MSHIAHALPLPDPSINPEFYASIPSKRFLAWVVDTVLIAISCLVLSILSIGVGFFFWPILFVIISFAYRSVTLARGSATWGMALMAVEVRRHDGERLDWLTAMLHTLGYMVSMALFLPQVVSVILMLISPRAQGLTDHVLGTVVINRRA